MRARGDERGDRVMRCGEYEKGGAVMAPPSLFILNDGSIATEVHHFRPCGDEILNEFFSRIIGAIDFGHSPQF